MNPIITNDRILALIEHAKSVSSIEGAFAELGVFEGGTSRILAELFPNRRFYACDTFSGLPKEQYVENIDTGHRPGEFQPHNYHEVINSLNAIPNIKVVEGMFPDSVTEEMKNEKFAFVHVDFDFYEGTKQAIAWMLPRLQSGAILAFDDFQWHGTPGVEQAIAETIGLDAIKISKETNNSHIKQVYYVHP